MYLLNVYLAHPRCPSYSKAGQDLAGGYFACLFALCGDLDAGCKYFKLPRWSSHSEPCAICPCTYRGTLSWQNNRSDAPWIRACFTPASWNAKENKSTCPLFRLPGVSGCIVALDLMHSKYLGVSQYVLGSIMYLLVHFQLVHSDPFESLKIIAAFIKKFQKDAQTIVRYGQNLTKLSMFHRDKEYPKLRGKAG